MSADLVEVRDTEVSVYARDPLVLEVRLGREHLFHLGRQEARDLIAALRMMLDSNRPTADEERAAKVWG